MAMERDAVAEIKERLSIVDVVSPHVKLTRAGKSLVGLCPFHKEKTGSFHVSPERNSYHCFGCGEGGDIFTFVEKIEGVDFKGALKLLADKAHVPLDRFRGSDALSSKKERLRDVMNVAAQWYTEKLPRSTAESYAIKRGLTDETVRRWGLGYAPESWRALLEALSAKGFTLEELTGAGLVKEADGKPGTYYDRFRDRLMFPIRDAAGRVVAFTGRALSKDENAKYLNSPETMLYHKSEILFGMDKAKDAIRSRGFALLMEGQMDVLHAHQAGFENAIALSGTALSEKHMALIKRYSENLMLVLDADTAGLSATAKAAQLALRQGLRVKAAKLPSGKDPADLLLDDVQDFTARVKSAKPIVEFFLGVLGEQESDPHRLVRKVEAVVLPLIKAMQSPMEREHFLQVTARALGLSTEAVRESLLRAVAPSVYSSEESVRTADVKAEGPAQSQRERRLSELVAIARAYPDTPLERRIEKEYGRITGVQVLPKEGFPESAIFEAEQSLGEDPSEGAADELLRAFEAAVIREAYQEAVAELRKAEAAGDAEAVRRAESACAVLAERLAEFGR